jgi:hypothetical protein
MIDRRLDRSVVIDGVYERKILDELIYERSADGKEIYYAGYKDVLLGKRSLEEIMGSGYLQSKIIVVILRFLFSSLDMREYEVLANEVGFYHSRGWRSLDIGIFRRRDLEREGLHSGYVRSVPISVIEVDSKADLSRYYDGDFERYMKEKVKELLREGVSRVVWYITVNKSVVVACDEDERSWGVYDWDKEIEVVDGVRMSLGRLLEDEV